MAGKKLPGVDAGLLIRSGIGKDLLPELDVTPFR